LGLTIIDFARINNREETFDVHGYLEMRWVDKRLKRDPGSGRMVVQKKAKTSPLARIVDSTSVVHERGRGN